MVQIPLLILNSLLLMIVHVEEAGKGDQLIESTHQVEVKLIGEQADPNSPLYSVKSFEDLGLSPELLKGVYAMGFTKPSKIQERALPLLISPPYIFFLSFGSRFSR